MLRLSLSPTLVLFLVIIISLSVDKDIINISHSMGIQVP